MVLLLVFMQLTRDLFAIAKFLLEIKIAGNVVFVLGNVHDLIISRLSTIWRNIRFLHLVTPVDESVLKNFQNCSVHQLIGHSGP